MAPVERFCARGLADPVSRDLCASASPTSFSGLVKSLRLDAYYQFAITTNSASLDARRVNPLNPRLILMRYDARTTAPDAGFAALAFTRGEPLVELVSRDPVSGELRFLLVGFALACMQKDQCQLVDLLTDAIERGWLGLWVATDDDLKNTPRDCLRCHQVNGPGTPRILRMQERKHPWAHWLISGPGSTESSGLFNDFYRAHPQNEPFGGLEPGFIDIGAPTILQGLIESQGFSPQPNEFASDAIARELLASDGSSSATWNGLYATAISGNAIPVPYAKVRATDPDRQARAADSYARVAARLAPPSDLLDIGALLSDEAERAMSIRPRLGATGREILVQMCHGCHNSRLDQTISRARFNIDTLDALPRDEKREAIERIRLPAADPRKMPPPIESELSLDEIERVATELAQ